MLVHDESRYALVKCWMEWLGRTYSIYNVDNKHQCFNEFPRSIIRPFREENNFFGCVKCGKYHFCFHSHHTCDSIAPTMDINNNMPTCAYSGQTIKNVHNEVIGNYSDVVRFHSDLQHGVSFIPSLDAMNTTSISSSASLDSKRVIALENMVLSNSIQKKKSPSKKERRLIDRQDMNRYFFRRGEGVVETMENEDIDVERAVNKSGKEDEEEDDEDDEYDPISDSTWVMEVEEDDDSKIHGVIAKNKRIDREVDIEQLMTGEYDCWESEITEESHLGKGDEDEEEDITAYDDRLTRMKNPHNNIIFWDEYFSFLADKESISSLIAHPKTVSTQEEENHHYQSHNSDVEDEEYKRKGGHIYDNSSASIFKVDPERWTPAISLIVEEETKRIIDIILRTRMIQEHKNVVRDEHNHLLDRLTAYYHNIICNIIILIYHSPHIEKLALIKHEKHEKQGKSSYSSKITVSVTDISLLQEDHVDNNNGSNPVRLYQRAYDLVCPKKICASLMLQLFTDMFFLSDNMTNHIHVWVNDPWLTYMKKEVFDDIIMDYNIIVDPINHHKKRYIRKSEQFENIFFKKNLTATSSIIRTSLSAYNRHPMWLSSMIYNYKRQ